MTAEKINEIYTSLVHWVADTAPPNWKRVEVNMEMVIDGEEVANSWIIRCFVGDHQEKIDDYPASGLEKIKMRDMFKQLNDFSEENGDRWTVCDLTVLSNGKYTVDYKYDPPPRLSGDILSGSQTD